MKDVGQGALREAWNTLRHAPTRLARKGGVRGARQGSPRSEERAEDGHRSKGTGAPPPEGEGGRSHGSTTASGRTPDPPVPAPEAIR